MGRSEGVRGGARESGEEERDEEREGRCNTEIYLYMRNDELFNKLFML